MTVDHLESKFQACFEVQRPMADNAGNGPLRLVFFTPVNKDFARAVPPVDSEHVWTFPVQEEGWRFCLYCVQHLGLEKGKKVDQVIMATGGDAGYFSTTPRSQPPNSANNVGGLSGNETVAKFGRVLKRLMEVSPTVTLPTLRFAGSAVYKGVTIDGKKTQQAFANALGGFVYAGDASIHLNPDGNASTSGAQWLATHGQTEPSQIVPAPSSGAAKFLLSPHP